MVKNILNDCKKYIFLITIQCLACDPDLSPQSLEEMTGEKGIINQDLAQPHSEINADAGLDAHTDADTDLDQNLSYQEDMFNILTDMNLEFDMEGPDSTVINPETEDDQVPTRIVAGLPQIHDFSGAPPDRVNELIQRAFNGLGLNEESGPNERDRVFIGLRYLAWIDETGFYGKINGLWLLNGEAQNLDFISLDGDRPVNTFAVGERGAGVWPSGYMGAEHIEVPNRIPEEDDDPNCGIFPSFCAQYSHAEAAPFTNLRIPTWRACNEGSPTWDSHFRPYLIESTEEGLRLMYEGPLTKRGDFGGSETGNHCHEDWLFSDGIRRRVYLRVGYELFTDDGRIDRLMQVKNPAGNPEFGGDTSFIGGFVMTSWPQPHPLKQLNRHVRVTERQAQVNWQGAPVQILPGEWTALPNNVPEHDIVLGQANQAVTLSQMDRLVTGRSFTLSNHGPDHRDSGFCLCVVHGAIEMGGGLISTAVPNGQLSHLATRRLTIEMNGFLPEKWIYEAENDLEHQIGRLDGDGWSASTNLDEPGMLSFGPYSREWAMGSSHRALFRLMVDVADEREEVVIAIDIYDASDDVVLARQELPRSAFVSPFTYQDFSLSFNTEDRMGHEFEARVYWYDRSYVRLDSITIDALY